MPTIFQPRIAKKINKVLSVRVIVICSDHKLLWQGSHEGVIVVHALLPSFCATIFFTLQAQSRFKQAAMFSFLSPYQ